MVSWCGVESMAVLSLAAEEDSWARSRLLSSTSILGSGA